MSNKSFKDFSRKLLHAASVLPKAAALIICGVGVIIPAAVTILLMSWVFSLNGAKGSQWGADGVNRQRREEMERKENAKMNEDIKKVIKFYFSPARACFDSCLSSASYVVKEPQNNTKSSHQMQVPADTETEQTTSRHSLGN